MPLMRALALLAVLASPAAAGGTTAAHDWSARIGSILPAGLELPDAPLSVIGRPLPPPPGRVRPAAADTPSVDLGPIYGRHFRRTSGYFADTQWVDVAGTLDLAGDGFLAVTPRGGSTTYAKIQRRMSGSWNAGGQRYSVSLDVSIWRERLNNIIQVRDASGRVVWSMTIRELFRVTYAAGEPVIVGGRPYRLFYSAQPDGSGRSGLCFIYEDDSTGTKEYRFYLIPVEQLRTDAPSSYSFFGGDQVRLQLSPDRGTLLISR